MCFEWVLNINVNLQIEMWNIDVYIRIASLLWKISFFYHLFTLWYFFLSLRVFGLQVLSIQVQSWLQVSNNTGILNTCTWLWLTESEQPTTVVSIKDEVRNSVKVPEFDKHLKKTGGHISGNVVEITIKMKTIVRKPLMIIIIKLHLRNLDNYNFSL